MRLDTGRPWAPVAPVRRGAGAKVHCDRCGDIISGTDVVVAGTRFRLGPHRYVAVVIPDAPIRNSRQAAIEDVCIYRQASR